MIYDSPNWTVIRRMGIGDREHVRSNVLSIGCFQSRHLLYTVEACFRATAELGMMMPRVHINAAREHPVIMGQLIRLVHRYMQFDAQLIEHGFVDHEHFEKLFETCDIIVQPKTEPNLNIDTYVDELVDLIKFAWRTSGERILRGNFQRWSDAQLRTMYPAMWPDSTNFYKDFIHATPI